jgi:hypothetical protein
LTLTDDGDIDVGLEGFSIRAPSTCWSGAMTRSADIAASRIYTGALSNSGERLRLIDPTGSEIDIVNSGGGAWPAGDADDRSSMERAFGVWHTFTGFYGLGHDAGGQPVRGTPGGPNSALLPTPMPTWIPGRVVINEALIRPHYDWEGTGGVTTDDEFIELYNRGPGAVNLKGWTLDDVAVGGSAPYDLPAITLEQGEYKAFFRSRTNIALNDGGDSIRLSAPDGSRIDKIIYLRVRAYNLSYGRLPDGDDVLAYGLWPTPGKQNRPYVPPAYPIGAVLINEVAWAGTEASANDEWIELWNPGAEPIHLDGWILTDDNAIRANLTGRLPAGGYTVLERTDDRTISDRCGLLTRARCRQRRAPAVDRSFGERDRCRQRRRSGWPAGDGEPRRWSVWRSMGDFQRIRPQLRWRRKPHPQYAGAANSGWTSSACSPVFRWGRRHAMSRAPGGGPEGVAPGGPSDALKKADGEGRRESSVLC